MGVEDGLLPHQQSLDEGHEEEERRLMYVGITRARESLALCYARRRKRFGEQLRCRPSRFLDELPAEHVAWKGREEPEDAAAAKDRGRAHLARLKEMFGS